MKTIKGTWAYKQRMAINSAKSQELKYDVYKEQTTMAAYKALWLDGVVVNKIFELMALYEHAGQYLSFTQLCKSTGLDPADLTDKLAELHEERLIVLTCVHKTPHQMKLMDNTLRLNYRLPYRVSA